MSEKESENRVSYEDMLGWLHEICRQHQQQLDFHSRQLRYFRGAGNAIRRAIAQKTELDNLREEKQEWLDKVKETLIDQWVGPHSRPVPTLGQMEDKFGTWQYADGQTIKVE